MYCSICYILLISLSFGYAEDKIPLYFSFITTKTGRFIASGAIPVIDKALEQINSRSDILQNYTLQYTKILDSNCNIAPALGAFLHLFNNDSQPTYVSLLCCGCSVATIHVAELSHYWNIPQVAFAAAASVLSNRDLFRNFYRTLPSFQLNAATMAQLMRQFGWQQMAIITQDENLFSVVKQNLQVIFDQEGWTLDTSVTLKSNLDVFPYEEVFSAIMNEDYRIININTYGTYAYNILCEAYHRGLTYPEYVWFTPDGGFSPLWWTEESNSSCPHWIVAKALNGSFGFVPRGYIVDEDNAFSGENATSFINDYRNLLQQPQYQEYNEFGIAGAGYDAMWSIAIGLDIASKKIAAGNDSGCENLNGELVPLEMFDYRNEKLGCIMRKSFDEIMFTGITGDIMFEDGQRPHNLFLLRQYRELSKGYIEREVVAEIYHYSNYSTFEFRKGESEHTLWEDGAPYDGFVMKRIHPNNIYLEVIYYMLASFGMIFAGVCLVFNIVFRKRKVVKLSSPNLNYLIIVGSVLLYTCVYLYVYSVDSFDQQDLQTFICNFRVWLFSIGCTLCFAVILSKTWRIYYIFTNPTDKKKTIKDWILIVVVAIVVAIGVFILLIGTSIPDSRLEAFDIVDTENEIEITSDGIRHENHVYICSNKYSVVWLGISFAYKGSLQVIALFMAFHTRRVKIKALNDSKEIAAIIYINSIILVILAVTEFALQHYHDVYAALFGLVLFIEASLFLGLLFVPKMVSLYYDPNGEKLFSHSTPGVSKSKESNSQILSKADLVANQTPYNVEELKAMIKELEAQLGEKNSAGSTNTVKEQSDSSMDEINNNVENGLP